ncbi:hypothetical protein pb186bvf_009267 [Paramecium bursaria]
MNKAKKQNSFNNILKEINIPKSYRKPIQRKPKLSRDPIQIVIKIQRAWRYYQRKKQLKRLRLLEGFIDKQQFKLEIQGTGKFEEILIQRLFQNLQITCTTIQMLQSECRELKERKGPNIQQYLTQTVNEIKTIVNKSQDALNIKLVEINEMQKNKFVSHIDQLIGYVEQL